MAGAHTHGMARICGATTVVIGQDNVFVNGQLWAVHGDPNSHGQGNLVASGNKVFINGKPVIINAPDGANPDTLCDLIGPPHCGPSTAAGSGNVFAYED